MFKIAVLPGDGIGPEITVQAVRVLEAVGRRYNHQFEFKEGLVGGAALDAMGTPLPAETLELCRTSDAILFGAVGGPKWDGLPLHLRPEAGGILALRKEFGLYANLRPVKVYPSLVGAPSNRNWSGVDIMVLRSSPAGSISAKVLGTPAGGRLPGCGHP